MIQAAPLIISFARVVPMLNKLIGAVGITELGNRVNNYIQENPDESEKIFQMIMPSQGIANILKNKSSEGDEEVSEDIDVEVEEKPKKLSGKEKGMRIKEAIRRARAGRGNYSSPDAEGSAVDIRGSVIREVEDMGIADKDLKDNYDPDKPKFDYEKFFKRRRKADGGAIGIEVLFEEKNPRQGLFMGGSPLDGQALSIYNSMNAYGFDDQAIANALQEQGLYTPPGSDTPETPPTTIQPIGFQGGDNTSKDLLPTFSKDLSGDSRFNYLTPQEQGVKYRFDRSVEPREGLMGFFDKVGNKFKESKFFQPKIKGTLGDRLLKQSQGMTIPSLTGAFAKLRSPFNPQSPTYNAALPMQLNFLEMGQVGDKSGLNLIGRNEGSGLLQYGVDSVLSGKNVISGFGTNDYETALRNFISRMNANTKISDARKTARLAAAQAELDALMAKQAQEYKDSGTQAEVAALQKEIDSGKYSGGSDFAQSNQAAVGGGNTATNAQGQTASQATSAGTGTSQGYSQHYARGGLVTMFKEKR